MILQGDCRDVLATLDEASVDAIVTDPPYELGFMGRAWDSTGVAYDVRTWEACLRVLKPGGHLLAFGGTRTYHRMACAIEDAGFQIRDQLQWLYGSGFPKSLDVSKAIDKAAGAEREVVGTMPDRWTGKGAVLNFATDRPQSDVPVLGAPATDAARQWDGWGTALKPANEPICLARKPLVGTVAANVLEHGTGALNIDGCRIATDDELAGSTVRNDIRGGAFAAGHRPNPGDIPAYEQHAAGRWPANVLLTHHPECVPAGTMRVRSNGHYPAARGKGGLSTSGHAGQDGLEERHTDGEVVEVWSCHEDCPVRILDEQSGESASTARVGNRSGKDAGRFGVFAGQSDVLMGHSDSGGASRFFYVAKPSRSERGEENHHPTVKPVDLMRYLVRLVTPPGGVVLDPFAGSGTTLLAAQEEGFYWIACELHAEHIEIIRARTAQRPLFGGAVA